METFTHPEDFARVVAAFADTTAGGLVDIEFRVQRPDGEVRWVHGRGRPETDAAGRPVRISGTEVDITERKAASELLRQSETKFRDLWENSRDAQVLCLPPDWKFSSGNAAAVALYGARDPQHLAQCTPNELTPELQPEGTLSAEKTPYYLEIALREGSTFFECTHQRLDGTLILVEISLNRITIDNLTGVQATIRDITERKLLEQRVAQRTAELERANRAKSEFLATMSHELRTPLNAIIGYAELMKDHVMGPLLPEQTEGATSIFDAGNHLLSLISDILDLSKLEAGSLMADERKLKQIVYNLLSNAVKFTPEGGSVRLSAQRCTRSQIALPADRPGRLFELPAQDDPGQDQGQTVTSYIQITVEDSGVGVSQEDMGQLFESFVQVDSSLARRYSGTGLGLALVRRLTELHAGALAMSSLPGQGTRMIVWLPLLEIPKLELAKEQLRKKFAGQLVLVVEDDALSRNLMRLLLQQAGLRVEAVDSGRAAVERVRQQQYAAVLMDVNMPEMSGLEATLSIREMDGWQQQVPVLAITADSSNSMRWACTDAGMNGFLAKPVKPTLLHAHLTAMLEHAEQARSDLPWIDINFSQIGNSTGEPSQSSTDECYPGLDLSQGTEIWGQKAMWAENLRLFASEYSDYPVQMRQAEPASLRNLAHKIKGAAANLALTQVAQSAGKLEQNLRNAVPSDDALQQLCADLQQALDSIAQFTISH